MTVEPIREKEKIEKMYHYLNQSNPKYAMIFKFGINTGLRIGDIIPVRVRDIYSKEFEFKDYFTLTEKKTGKQKKIKLNETLRNALSDYVSVHCPGLDDYLFPSQKGGMLAESRPTVC